MSYDNGIAKLRDALRAGDDMTVRRDLEQQIERGQRLAARARSEGRHDGAAAIERGVASLRLALVSFCEFRGLEPAREETP